MSGPQSLVRVMIPCWLKLFRCRRSLPRPAHSASPAPALQPASWRKSPMLSMPDDNESQPQDAVDQDAPASSHDGAAAPHGVARTDPKGKSGSSKAPTVINPLTQSDHGVQHLTSLLDKSASDLDLEVIRLKSERAEMTKGKETSERGAPQHRAQTETPLHSCQATQHQRPPRGLRHARARQHRARRLGRACRGLTVLCADLRASVLIVDIPEPLGCMHMLD